MVPETLLSLLYPQVVSFTESTCIEKCYMMLESEVWNIFGQVNVELHIKN